MAQFNFDANAVKPNAGLLPPIPKGNYRAIIVASEIKPTSNGTGAFIEAQFKVVGGQHDGHIIYHNFNIRNQSEKAVEIGYGQLSAVCHAVGVLNMQDTSQLHNRPLCITVKVGGGGQRPEGGTYDERNEITGFKKDEIGGPAATPSDVPINIPPATEQAPAPAPAPTPTPAPAAPTPAVMVRRMTDKASGATYEQFIQNGWTDAAMIEQGYMEMVHAEIMPSTPAPSVPTAKQPWETANPTPAATAAPAAKTEAPAAAAPENTALPPWMQ